MRLASLSPTMLAKSVVVVTLSLLSFGVSPAFATTIPISGVYTGPFFGTVQDGFPLPVTLLTTGTLTDPTAPFSLTSGSLSHNTDIVDFSSPQSIYNGGFSLFGGGNSLNATYTGSFQLTSPTAGTFSLTLLFTGGSGVFAGATGTGLATGTALFAAPPPPDGFDGDFTANLSAILEVSDVPEPGTLALFATGLALAAGMNWRSALGRRRSRIPLSSVLVLHHHLPSADK